MARLANLPVRQKFLVAFALLLCLMLGIGGVAISQLGVIREEVHSLGQNWLPEVDVISRMTTAHCAIACSSPTAS